MSNEWITHRLEKNISILQINRGAKKNALTLEMYREMTQALQSAEADETARVHLILGEDSVFSAGNDIQDFVMGIGGQDQNEAPPVLTFLKTLSSLKKPIIAGANGHAVGIGTTLLLHCDLVILGEEALLKTPFVDLGLCPEAASSLLMPQRIGHQRAAQMLLLGDSIDAMTAYHWGLANRVVSPERLTQTCLTLAEQLAQKPPEALMLSKKLMMQGLTQTIQERIVEEGVQFMARLQSQEAREVLMRFLKK